MFLFMNIAAASIDGFIAGFAVTSTGTKFGIKEYFRAFTIILLCCMSGAFRGKYLAVVHTGKYINITGWAVMLYLAFRSLPLPVNSEKRATGIYAVSLSVAANAAIVCIYLTLDGYGVLPVCLLCAASHSILMAFGAKTAGLLIKEKRRTYAGILSSLIFFVLAVCKICEM